MHILYIAVNHISRKFFIKQHLTLILKGQRKRNGYGFPKMHLLFKETTDQQPQPDYLAGKPNWAGKQFYSIILMYIWIT